MRHQVLSLSISCAFLFNIQLVSTPQTISHSIRHSHTCKTRFTSTMSSSSALAGQNFSDDATGLLVDVVGGGSNSDSTNPTEHGSERANVDGGTRGRGRARGRGRGYARGRGRGRGRGSGRGSGGGHEDTSKPKEPSDPRLFLGIELPDDVLSKLVKLGTEEIENARTLPQSSYHITLHFLGKTNLQKLKDVVADIVESKSEQFPAAFQGNVQGVGAFPTISDTDARVLWAGLAHPCDPLHQLHNVLREGLVNAGYQFEERPYSPHITVAKCDKHLRRRKRKQKKEEDAVVKEKDEDEGVCEDGKTVTSWAEEHEDFDGGEFDVKEFVIFETIQGRGSPKYEIRERYELKNS